MQVGSKIVSALAAAGFFMTAGQNCAVAQTPPEAKTATAKDTILLTIFLRHDQSKTLDQINKELADRNWMRDFPPAGVDVETWYIMMGIGQVVTLRVPPEKLREVNRVVEQKGWSAYRTDFYATYDYKEIARAEHEKALKEPAK